MARAVILYSTILGLPESTKKGWDGYNELSDVLNYIGVMAKRNEIPYVYVIIPPSKKKPFVQYDLIGDEYYIPKNWRDVCMRTWKPDIIILYLQWTSIKPIAEN